MIYVDQVHIGKCRIDSSYVDDLTSAFCTITLLLMVSISLRQTHVSNYGLQRWILMLLMKMIMKKVQNMCEGDVKVLIQWG